MTQINTKDIVYLRKFTNLLLRTDNNDVVYNECDIEMIMTDISKLLRMADYDVKVALFTLFETVYVFSLHEDINFGKNNLIEYEPPNCFTLRLYKRVTHKYVPISTLYFYIFLTYLAEFEDIKIISRAIENETNQELKYHLITITLTDPAIVHTADFINKYINNSIKERIFW